MIVSSSLKEINDADKIVFPGQSAAQKKCMSSINDKKFSWRRHKKFYRKTVPKGIRMGMQVLMDFSEENNGTECLGDNKRKSKKVS